jgi:hypothetical protein
MANINRFVNVSINNGNLLPQNIPSRFPVLLTSHGAQLLNKLIHQYEYADKFYNYAVAQSSALGSILQTAFAQTPTVSQIWGVDITLSYTMTFSTESLGASYTLEWLDCDNSQYMVEQVNYTSLDDLLSHLQEKVTKVTFTLADKVLTITPKSDSPHQVVRINFNGASLSDINYQAKDADLLSVNQATTVVNALINAVETFKNAYALVVEDQVFMPKADYDSKNDELKSLALAVEATSEAGDNRKVLFISSKDANIKNSTLTSDILSILKSNNLERSLGAYYDGIGMLTSSVCKRLALNDGNNTWAYTTLDGITYQFLSNSDLNAIYQINDDGNISSSCKNGNYFVVSGGKSFFYPGITGSGLPIDITILADNLARDCAYAQLDFAATQSSLGKPITYDQAGLNSIKAIILGVGMQYLSDGLIDAVDKQGTALEIALPTIEEINKSSKLQTLKKNRVLSGIKIKFIPAGGINKFYETLIPTL